MTTLLSLLFFIPTVSAQQPHIVNQIYATDTVPIAVEQPTTSNSYYGDLKGEPEYYRIYSQQPFRLYLSILVPAIDGIDKDVSADVLTGSTYGEKVFTLSAEDADWHPYYERHTGDDYFVGPQLKEEGSDEENPKGVEVDPGTYIVKVYSPDNRGKYVLVVGDASSITPVKAVRMLLALPKLKVYFGKSPFTAYSTIATWSLIVRLIAPFALIAGGVWWWKKRKK